MITLAQYVTETGRLPVREAYDESSEAVQVDFDVGTEYLRNQSRANWRRPKAAKLSHAKKGFRDYFEIRLYSERVQQRPIGFFWPDDQTFVVLLWATEKGGSLRPKDWRKIADERREAIESGVVRPQLFYPEEEDEK